MDEEIWKSWIAKPLVSARSLEIKINDFFKYPRHSIEFKSFYQWFISRKTKLTELLNWFLRVYYLNTWQNWGIQIIVAKRLRIYRLKIIRYLSFLYKIISRYKMDNRWCYQKIFRSLPETKRSSGYQWVLW